MPQFSDSIDIARPPEDVWRAIGTPERWFEGYLETRTRSADYVSFKGLGKLAAPIASRDIKRRWESSLARLKATAEGGQ